MPPDVFEGFIIYAATRFPHECLGYLLGEIPKGPEGCYIVNRICWTTRHVKPRSLTEVEQTEREQKRMLRFIAILGKDPRLSHIGFCHSHTRRRKGSEKSVRMSRYDIASAIEYRLPIDIIAKIEYKKRNLAWTSAEYPEIGGESIQGIYDNLYFRIAAYFTQKDDHEDPSDIHPETIPIRAKWSLRHLRRLCRPANHR